MLAEDPWSWTVDDLIAEVCHSTSLFRTAGCRLDNLPDAAALEGQFRDQEVTGATFLATLDSNRLRTELGIQSFSQRLALTSVIELLRNQSAAYKQHTTTAGVQALNLNSGHTQKTASSIPNMSDTSSRKRQKVAHITTTPLPANRQAPLLISGLSAADLEKQIVVDGNGEWDYLMRWEAAGREHAENEDWLNDANPTDNEDLSDEEGQAPEVELEDVELYVESELAVEDPQEIPDVTKDKSEAQNRDKLSSDEIVAIINEWIEHFSNTWTIDKEAQKGEKIKYDPISMWEQTEAAGQRQQLIEKYKTDGAYYQQRLDRLCDEVLKFPGKSADRVRYQCRNLEETIDSIELSNWLLGIYSLPPVQDSEDEAEDKGKDKDEELAAYQTQPSVEIIDLGSPPESSDDEQGRMLVDISPAPELETMDPRSCPSDRFNTLNTVIADTIEPAAYAPSDSPLIARTATSRSLAQFGENPENASIASASRWSWIDLINTQDRKRIVIKALQEMKWNDRETIETRLRIVGKAELIREIPACIRMLAKNENKMQGVLPRDMPKIATFTKLFLCWWLCDNYFRVEPSKCHLEELQECLAEGSPDPGTFCDFLNTVIATTFSPEALRHPEQPSQAEIIEISDDDAPPAPSESQRKKQPYRPQASQRPAAIVID